MRAYRLLLRLFPKSFRHEYGGRDVGHLRQAPKRCRRPVGRHPALARDHRRDRARCVWRARRPAAPGRRLCHTDPASCQGVCRHQHPRDGAGRWRHDRGLLGRRPRPGAPAAISRVGSPGQALAGRLAPGILAPRAFASQVPRLEADGDWVLDDGGLHIGLDEPDRGRAARAARRRAWRPPSCSRPSACMRFLAERFWPRMPPAPVR